MSEPLVSVCIPTFNRESTVRHAIASALLQTYSNIEVIVSDNASTDQTAQLVGAIEDPRVKFHQHKTNLGAEANIRWLLSAARGKYLLILSSDDTIEPGLVARGVELLEQDPSVGVYTTRFRVLNPSGETIAIKPTVKPGASLDLATLLRGNKIGLLSSIFRRQCYEQVGPIVSNPALDWVLWVRTLLSGWTIWVDDHILASYALSPDADSARLHRRNSVEAVHRILDEDLKRFGRSDLAGDLARGIAELYALTAGVVFRSGNRRSAWQLYLDSLKLHKANHRAVFGLFLACLPSAWDKPCRRLLRGCFRLAQRAVRALHAPFTT